MPVLDDLFARTGQPIDLAAQDALRAGSNAADVDNGVQAVGGMMVRKMGGPLPIEAS